MGEENNISWGNQPIEKQMERAQVVSVDCNISEAIQKLQDSRSRCLCVVHEGGALAGTLTEDDVVNRVIDQNIEGSEPVSEFINREPYSLHMSSKISQVVDIMGEHVLYYLPLCNEEMHPNGIFSIRELIHIFADKTELKGNRYVWSNPEEDLGAFQEAIIEVMNLPISFAMSRYGYDNTISIGKNDSVQNALRKFKGTGQRAALVYDEGDLIGFFRIRDVPFRLYQKNHDFGNMPVGELVTSLPKEISEEECLASAFNQMSENGNLFLHHKTNGGRYLLVPGAGLLAYLYDHIHDDV